MRTFTFGGRLVVAAVGVVAVGLLPSPAVGAVAAAARQAAQPRLDKLNRAMPWRGRTPPTTSRPIPASRWRSELTVRGPRQGRDTFACSVK